MKKIILLIIILGVSALFAQKFDIEKFTDPDKYGWGEYSQQKESRENLDKRKEILKLYKERKQDYATNIMKSAILPGWGQISAGKTMRGIVFLETEIILAGAGYYYYGKAMNYYDKYKKASYIEDINKYYQDAKTPYTIYQVIMVTAIATWAFNIFDTIAVTAANNSGLWERTVQEVEEKKLIITPVGFIYRF